MKKTSKTIALPFIYSIPLKTAPKAIDNTPKGTTDLSNANDDDDDDEEEQEDN
jgi:hypothetical protein